MEYSKDAKSIQRLSISNVNAKKPENSKQERKKNRGRFPCTGSPYELTSDLFVRSVSLTGCYQHIINQVILSSFTSFVSLTKNKKSWKT